MSSVSSFPNFSLQYTRLSEWVVEFRVIQDNRNTVFIFTQNFQDDTSVINHSPVSGIGLILQRVRSDIHIKWFDYNTGTVSPVFEIRNIFPDPDLQEGMEVIDYNQVILENATRNSFNMSSEELQTFREQINFIRAGQDTIISDPTVGHYSVAAGEAIHAGQPVTSSGEDLGTVRGVTFVEEILYTTADQTYPFVTSTFTNYPFPPQEEESSIQYPPMKCVCCAGKISHPQNMEKLLGKKETLSYLEYCKSIGTDPQLYCCSCYTVIEQSPKAMEGYHMMMSEYKMLRNQQIILHKEIETQTKLRVKLDGMVSEKSQFIGVARQQMNYMRNKFVEEKVELQSKIDEKDSEILSVKKQYEESITKLQQQLMKEKVKNMLLDINPLAALIREKFQ